MKDPRSRATTQTKLTIASALVDAPLALRETCAALPAGVAGTIYTSLADPSHVSLELGWPDIKLINSVIGRHVGPHLRYVARWPEPNDGKLIIESRKGADMVFETHSFSAQPKLPFASWRTRKMNRIAADLALTNLGGVGCTGDGDVIIGHFFEPADKLVLAAAALFDASFASTLLRLFKIGSQIASPAQIRVSDHIEMRVNLRNIAWDSLLSICTTCDDLQFASFSELGHFAGALGANQADELQIRITHQRITLACGIEFDAS